MTPKTRDEFLDLVDQLIFEIEEILIDEGTAAGDLDSAIEFEHSCVDGDKGSAFDSQRAAVAAVTVGIERRPVGRGTDGIAVHMQGDGRRAGQRCAEEQPCTQAVGPRHEGGRQDDFILGCRRRRRRAPTRRGDGNRGGTS